MTNAHSFSQGRSPITLIIVAITVLVILVAALFYKDEQSNQINKNLVLHTYDVTGHIQLFFNRLKDVELGARGYNITADPKYLAPYYDALKDSTDDGNAADQLQQHHSVKQELSILKSLVRDNPVEIENLDELANDTDALIQHWATSIKSQQEVALPKAPAVGDDFRQEDEFLDQVHRLVNIMIAEENGLLKQRTELVEGSEAKSNTLIFFAIIAFYLCIVFSIQLYQKSKDRGRAKLLRYMADLEENERALALSNSQKDAVLASTAYMLVTTDVKGLVTMMNGEAQKTLGYSVREIVGKETPAIWHDPAELKKRAQDLSKELGRPITATYDVFTAKIAAGKVEEREWSLIRKDGTALPVLLSVTAIQDSEGATSGYLNTIKDITERKASEQLKSEFISIVSHELRTPLTSIRGSLGLVVGVMAKDVPEKALNLVSIAYKNSERLILLINDILDIDKIASGQMRFDMSAEPLDALMRQAVEANNSYAEKFGVSFNLKLTNSDVSIDVDASRFIQVISNLLSNAAKFSPKGAVVDIYAEMTYEAARIFVKDRGPGMSEEFCRHIFEKFSQADSSATRAKGGTGLGLHISKEIVEHMGGAIGFETALEKGTTFWVAFPRAGHLADESETLLEPRQTRGRVLLCGDDEALAAVLRQQIVKAGFATDQARTIADARALLAQHSYAAMTLDLAASEAIGLEFIRELRMAQKTAHLPIVAVSAEADAGEEGLKGDAFGIIDWFTKPLDKDKLTAALRRLSAAKGDITPHILHVEDDQDLTRVLAAALQGKAQLVNVSTLRGARQLLAKEHFSLIILDAGLPDGNGLTLLTELNSLPLAPIPVVILSADAIPKDIQKRVAAALVKSRMSETKIVEIILSLIPSAKDGQTIAKSFEV